MAHLYFMQREFEGLCFALDEAIENRDVQLIFEDSWYWLHYRFFNCRDTVCSEISSVVRTHLYNLVAMLYRHFEILPERTHFDESRLRGMIDEAIEIAEYSRPFPLSLWVFGDETSKAFLGEWLAPLPSTEQIEHILNLPHFRRMQMERLPYSFDAEALALKRYRNEFAAFNKRKKLVAKNEQRRRMIEPEPNAGPVSDSGDTEGSQTVG